MKKIVMVMGLFIQLFFTASISATEVELEGDWRYDINTTSRRARVIGGTINNTSETSQSGKLRLRLFLTLDEYDGSSISGNVLLVSNFKELEKGYYYYDIDKTFDYSGTIESRQYYVTLVLEENIGDQYYIQDAVKFDEKFAYAPRAATSVDSRPAMVVPTVPDNSSQISFWQGELAREQRNLMTAERDLEWAR